ncbi:YggT family protein [Candidatus Hepatincolaceae symbiont of Richtersius coronifer]
MGNIILLNIFKAVILIANFYLFLMFIMAVLSILAVFQVVNLFSDNTVSKIYFLLRRIIDPPVNFIGRFIPRIGGIDLPFLVLLVLLWIIVDLSKYFMNSIMMTTFAF